jgi:hypothetical protein
MNEEKYYSQKDMIKQINHSKYSIRATLQNFGVRNRLRKICNGRPISYSETLIREINNFMDSRQRYVQSRNNFKNFIERLRYE